MRRRFSANAETAAGGAYMQMAAHAGTALAAAPGGEQMIAKRRLAAVLAFGAALTAAGVALAQTQSGSTPAPAASGPPPAQAPLPSGTLPQSASSGSATPQSQTPTTKPWYTDTTQPTYSVDPPPDTPSGVYLPAAVLGYAKSAAGCVTIGCDDGPHAGGAAGPSSSEPLSSGSPSTGSPSTGPTAPQPPDPEPSAPH